MTHTYDIHGMHCESCVGRVRSALQSVAGVSAAIVSLKPPREKVEMTRHIPTAELNSAVRSAGDYKLAESSDATSCKPASPAATEASEGAQRAKSQSSKTADDQRSYTCPMHPEVRRIGPGSCPRCGMALEPAAAVSMNTSEQLLCLLPCTTSAGGGLQAEVIDAAPISGHRVSFTVTSGRQSFNQPELVSIRPSICRPNLEERITMENFTKNEMTKRASWIGTSGLAVILASGLLTACARGQPTTPAEPPVDPASHAKHVAAGAMPTDTAEGDPALSQQISELQAKVAQLEAALAKNAPHPPAAAATAAGAMPGMAAPAASMTGMSGNAPGAMKPAGRMGGMAAPQGGSMNKMAMMQQMMGMMDKMMSMNDGPMPAPTPMPGGGGMGMMDMDDKMEMGGMGGGAMPAGAPAAGMSGASGMGMDKMEMAGMMGMGPMGSGAAGGMPKSMLPGFPGASHLYHIGATDFFLDHPQHIALTTEQQAALNKAKEQALLAKSTADRAIKQAEQDLWTLTSSDQPDAAAIEAKIAEIGKLTGDERLAFIRAVGDASKILTDAQRRILTGFAQPAPAAPAAPAMPAGGMKDM